MANRSYLSGPHRLLPGYASLAVSRSGVGAGSNSRASPPEFAYDAFPRSASGAGGRDGPAYNRNPSSTANSALGLAYPNVSEFPYGLSGVQMPTYNFGSELYNYVSNGFPRKSRMCTFCNKVFTRSTTRRYHERRCPLLRASNSLAKSEENSTAAAAAAAAALKEHQQRHKDVTSAISNPPPSAPRTSSSLSNTSSSQTGSNLPSAPTPASPPPPSLHPAYPTSFPPTSALGSSPSRNAAASYNYAHSYGSHFYNSISAAALASLDQNRNTLQPKKDSDSSVWPSSPSPSSKARDHSGSSILGNTAALPKSPADPGLDLTARYCADFSIRSQPPVFPPTSLRGAPRSPPSPEPGETKSDSSATITERRCSTSPQDFTRTPGRDSEWSSPNREKAEYPDKIAVANISGARLKVPSSSPPPMLWNNKARLERAQGQFMAVQPVDEDEEDEDDEEEDEEEVEEDEEQFNENTNLQSDDEDDQKKMEDHSGRPSHNKGTPYNPLVCQFCKKSFADTITRQAHEALHSQTKSYGCSLCSRAFHCAYSLRIHLLRHHSEGPFKCKQCGRTFEQIMALKSHLLSQHSLPKQETCSLKYFSLLDNSDSSATRSHSAVSDSEQDTKEKNSQAQRRSADSLPAVLKDTDQTTKTLRTNELEDSMGNGNLSNEETETEVCKLCNKAFAKSFIRFHERAHADQKPYECPICNKRFGYKNNMKSHMKLHQGLKPYQCQLCGARFTRGSTLRRHGRRHNISRNSMLDYVLYDHSAGPTRAVGVNNKTGMAAAAAAAAATTHASAAAVTAAAAANSQYVQHGRLPVSDQQMSKYLPHARNALPPTTTSIDTERYNSSGRRTPPRTSPMGLPSPRSTSNHLTTQAMASPMVGGLAAAAAANLFGYPGVAAPHLYQFYASTNQLMNYSAYTSNHGAQAVQSDALNLSLGKRKSPPIEEGSNVREKSLRRDSSVYDRRSPESRAIYSQSKSIKIEAQEPGEMMKRDDPNPFAPNLPPKKERQSDIESDNKQSLYDSKESLKISTEDFAAQVNICCPSPLVQSSTGAMHHQTSAGSPVGSSSCTEVNVQAQASPSGLSHHSSPANSAPSPSALSEGHLQELLLSFLTSGRMFRCRFCEIYFTEYAMFKLHQKYHQCDDAPFLCSVCGEDCKDKTYFTVHLSDHLGLGPKAALA